jgi:hypothetical protein
MFSKLWKNAFLPELPRNKFLTFSKLAYTVMPVGVYN